MKSYRDFAPNRARCIAAASLLLIAAGFALSAKGELPAWIRNIEAKTDVERAFFRAMQLPYGDVLFRRPPTETRPALGELIQQQPTKGDLYSLAALEDERRLDFVSAEKNWKLYSEKAANKAAALLDLADFYHRRLRPQEEIAVLRTLGNSPATTAEKFTLPNQQNSWSAFERILGIIQAQALGKEPAIATYRAWIARYPGEEQLYVRFLDFLVGQKEFDAANQLIASHQKQFPSDEVFPVKARALVEYRQGSVQQGLAVYEKSFQPLWQPELVKGYFDLLAQTQGLRKSLDEARAALNKNPEDLNATARVFYYYQQQGKLDAAQEAITNLRLHKESAKSPWTPQELYVCGRLLEDIHSYPEAARYYFALYSSKGQADSQERALTRLTDMLLTSPESAIRLGSGDLSMYKDIATMDSGPGYLNGILSLILNTTSPGNAYSAEEQRAYSYFHRSRGAELLTLLDKNFPNAEGRPDLHVKLLEFYANNSQSEAVLKGGTEFLAAFSKSGERTRVALLMADADARLQKPRDEFAIYDAILQELAARADNIPLGKSVANNGNFGVSQRYQRFQQPTNAEAEGEDGGEGRETPSEPSQGAASAFQVGRNTETQGSGPRSPDYSRVLERYLARLVQLKDVPQALGVLRREIDHNPDDPGLYERLASFLQQNNLSLEEEEVYRRAFARFSDPSWYSKLARLYLRYEKYSKLQQLTEDAVKQFDGSVLETYFASVRGGAPGMYLRLNQYANARFPHNHYFVNHLLGAYHSTPTYDQAAWLALIRQHWFEDARLRNEYFEYLASSRQLERELNALRQSAPQADTADWTEFVKKNPAAATEIAEAEIWRSHFEESAPVLKTLAEVYPAEQELDRKASSVFRSLAYFDPAKTAVAANVEENLLAANPGNTEILARIGDIYSDRDLFQQAAPYWERIPKVAPGESGGYLETATIYWDYFDFNKALRLLDEGRKKLGNHTLYGYEEGAIYETQRDYQRAVQEYAAAAVAGGGDSPAMGRLIELARRPKLRDLVNDTTEKLAVDSGYALPTVNLRLRVLEAANRAPEMAAFLGTALEHAGTMEQAAAIESIAQQRSLEAVRQKALEKQAALATDPVTRMQLRYALVRFYESKKDLAAAQRNIEALYQANPKILGVVRSTVDFYWRVKLYPQAITVLRQAAKDAYPQLSTQFSFEAARKSTEAKDFQQARGLLEALLKGSPYDSQYLAAMADTYAQAGDAQGLKQFYLDKISLFRNAPLAADDRKNRIATLRRGLIPALAQLKDYPGALDQYIELINNFPEDEGLATEAALYSQRYQREKQLLDFYAKTIQQSPRDFRWSMVLARMQASLEDFPAAVDSYGKSIAIRPDRSDLRIARAALEERLLRFDDAANDYEHLYQLAYKDPKWMEKTAEVRARQGRSADAVAALKAALIDVAPERAANYFEVARRLEAWGILEPAKSFAEQGVSAAGDELLAAPENHEGAKIYVRLMTRLRQQEKAYATLQNAMNAASNSLPVLKEQVAKSGISSVTDRQWRERVLATRQESARNGMHAALVEMGSAVAHYFTPEEKVTFSSFAQTLRTPMAAGDAKEFAVPLVQAAGLAEKEAAWRYELMRNSVLDQAGWMGQMTEFVQLQRQRLKFAELAGQLEGFVPRARPEVRAATLLNAAEAYRAAGDSDNELRVLSSLGPANLGGANQTRWYTLLLKKNPQQLVQVAGSWQPWGQPAADFVFANGDAELAHAVVAARSKLRVPVWGKSYTALTGLYFAEPSQPIKAAFVDALGDQTIGEREGKPVNRDNRLAGDIWFYYASRYGEYLADTRLDGANDFLSAELEQSPASSNGYLALGDFYLEHGDARKAIEQYDYTLELAPANAEVHDKLALAYFKDKNRAQAVAQWKLFFAAQLSQVNNVRLTESFWADFGRALDHVRTRGVFQEVRPEVEQLLRAYLRRNGNYRSNALLHSAYLAAGEPAAATAWLLDLSGAAPDPTIVLQDVADAPWIPIANRAPIIQRILEAKLAAVAKAEGLEQENAKAVLWSWQLRWVKYLVDTKQYSRAAEEIATLRKKAVSDSSALVPYEMQCAAQLGTLDTILSGYKSEPQTAPAAESLRIAAREIFSGGDKQSARKILEFVFARQLEGHQFVAANFLGLAEIRIADGDVAGAVALLKRLVLVAGDAYQNMDSSAALFEKTGHPAEALVFLEPLAKATPWEPSFRLRLSKAQLVAAQDKNPVVQSLAKLSAAPENPYALRVQAAIAMAGLTQAAELGSAELKVIAAGARSITPAASDHPYFYDSRLAAAQNAPNVRDKMEVLAKALGDSPSREDARVPFFRAASTIPADETALASIEELLHTRLTGRVAPGNSGDEETLGADEEADAGQTEVRSESNAALPPSQQSQLAREVALTLLRLDRLDETAAYLKIALSLEKTTAERARINAQLLEVRARLRRQRANAARQPILHAELEQDRLVRPRLIARAEATGKSPAKAGRKP